MATRKKVSICPKCGRNCVVIFQDLERSNSDWEKPGYVTELGNGRYEVECPGCGAHYISDVNLAVPCWEEREN